MEFTATIFILSNEFNCTCRKVDALLSSCMMLLNLLPKVLLLVQRGKDNSEETYVLEFRNVVEYVNMYLVICVIEDGMGHDSSMVPLGYSWLAICE